MFTIFYSFDSFDSPSNTHNVTDYLYSQHVHVHLAVEYKNKIYLIIDGLHYSELHNVVEHLYVYNEIYH